MKYPIHFLKIPALATLLLALLVGIAPASKGAQSTLAPRREELLNGLRVLIWNRPGDANVLLKLRIHSGAAFDFAGKAGTMALLSDALFPDPTTREYFTEELGGRLEVSSDYDAIDITLSGTASNFERIVELLSTALISTPLTPEVLAKAREARIKIARELNVSPTLMADRAIAARLFGDYPYGRPLTGSVESLARVERADVMHARERFLNPNNATLVVIGGVEERRAIRALRQLLGSWRKSETVVPATFRQPSPPDTRTLIIDLPGAETAEIRLAVRSLSRSDNNHAAATLLAMLVHDVWLSTQPELSKSSFFVRHEAHVLPGIFVMGASVPNAEAANTLAKARQVLKLLMKDAVTPALLERVKTEALAELSRQVERPESLANIWLDADTFQLVSFEEQTRQLKSVTVEDIRRLATKLFNDAPVVTVAVGAAARLKADLEREGKVEVFGETAPPPAAAPAKKP
jgi:zinc protease